MADTSVKLSGTYDSIEAYNILEEMRTLGTDVEGYKNDAQSAASTATGAVSTAQGYANDASGYASNASTYAGNASDSADEAAGYAANAYTSETNASTYATNASNSAGAAYTSEQNAAGYAADAAASEAVVAGALPLSGGTMTGAITLADGGNPLSTAGGTMTGAITLADGGAPLSTAVAGATSSNEANNVSLANGTSKNITSLSLSAGTWLVIGHVQFNSSSAGKFYGCGLTTSSATYNYADNGTVGRQSHGGVVSVQCVRWFVNSGTTTVYLVGWANEAVTVTKGVISAVRIK